MLIHWIDGGEVRTHSTDRERNEPKALNGEGRGVALKSEAGIFYYIKGV